MGALANAAYAEYVKVPAPGCDCDFHRGRWKMTEPPTLTKIMGALRYGKAGDPLPPGYCNHPGQAPPLSSYAPSPPDTEPMLSQMDTASSAAKTGYNCVRCNTRNEYAEANYAFGTYVCFNCRV